MSKKIENLKAQKSLIFKEKHNIFLTMEEKKQFALSGEDVPICISNNNHVIDYNVPIHQFILSKKKHIKSKKMKL